MPGPKSPQLHEESLVVMPEDCSGTGILSVGFGSRTGYISDRLEAWPTTSHQTDSSQSPFVFLFGVSIYAKNWFLVSYFTSSLMQYSFVRVRTKICPSTRAGVAAIGSPKSLLASTFCSGPLSSTLTTPGSDVT